MPAIHTYPGTVTPLRGLQAFVESEREVLFGRDDQRDGLAELVSGEAFRAGLLYGEAGVGKTSLLRAGVIPQLRDHGVIALLCDDVFNPVDSFVRAMTAHTGMPPADDERPISFLARVVAQALHGQQFIFIIDDVDIALDLEDDRAIVELGDMFARVVTRSSGRARFLFCCASERTHLFGKLEQRTGSLFPPNNRFELERFDLETAVDVLGKILSVTVVGADPNLARVIANELCHEQPMLPADVQIAAMAVRDLNITTLEALQKLGGAHELEREWLATAAASTGNERSALRLVAELAANPRPIPYAPDWAATRCSLSPEFARKAFEAFRAKGIVQPIASGGPDTHYMLSHQILIPRIREIAAPARADARKAFELLGSKVQSNKRLSLREFLAVRREGLTPATLEEKKVIDRSKRFFYIVAGAIAAAPILFFIIIYMTMSGSYYLDVDNDRVVVRAGKPGMSAFNWMPSSPSFGSIVADTGFTRSMIGEDEWNKLEGKDITGELGGDAYAEKVMGTLTPSMTSLIDYATTGNEQALEALRQGTKGPEDVVALLEALEPIGRGLGSEVAVVEASLTDPSPAVQTAALAVASSTAKRRPGEYHDVLAKALTSSDAELRRLAFSAVRDLGTETSFKLFQAALGANTDPNAQRELLAVVSTADTESARSAGSAVSVLVNRDVSGTVRDKARTTLRRAFTTEPADATTAALELAGDAEAPADDRVLALELLNDYAPEDSYEQIATAVEPILEDKTEDIEAAAWPLYARTAPKKAAGLLVDMLEKKSTHKMRQAMAAAWGEIAKTKDAAAQVALEKLLADKQHSSVRAAAARAYGFIGRGSQTLLIKMVKTEGYEVAVGAAYGLANSTAIRGASPGNAVGGVLQLWKRKGRSRREATRIFGHMAKFKPASAYSYLASASKNTEDSGLHVLGAAGLCNGMTAGHVASRRSIARLASHESVEVRRIVIDCVVENPKHTKTATSVASKLVKDRDPVIRAEAAQVLAQIASKGKVSKGVSKALVELVEDENRAVRIIAVRAMAAMGSDAPTEAAAAFKKVFETADESEKLVILAAARAISAGELVTVAASDESPMVRIDAIDTAIGTGTEMAETINAALTDDDQSVRRAALARLATHSDKLDQDSIDKSLVLAIRDDDEAIAQLALTTLARLGEEEMVVSRLQDMLGARSEKTRARAAAATYGLVERNPDKAVELLEPLLEDRSHDVRVAMVPALAAAYANTNDAPGLGEMLEKSEKHAMKRIVAAAAFIAYASAPSGADAAVSVLDEVAAKGPPLAKVIARLCDGLIKGSANGIGFLQQIVP